ncbi:DNA polymerase III, delta' subunit [Bartonella bacilliformis str. Heidi Mejia]|uniref:DNA polymerase III, delta' subunit n=2 Tax=Bartonella bacilliformis TaxID=774 RepID=A1UT07_BARBK|nr:DNA polymerase III subunit delta' [Bartonella bacilliformis]ABM45318.1 DNA polymerase III, delta' subunit [Bartonella bacilliformis KC583]AMG85903.1 DNA polymerase III subunit delta' [Bartonella bacilliformis]EKS43881.1 DNA polymerase III subunit delta' [Bartonella bacilliformis INS]EYS89886.1 DNA polymerase III, delta' subunit [Bartonella bacilliformis San Pedro600-02]EYS91949.1 DNA polymerase III, delta' subunit [Bartonella bacilliformis str. Heidi Mejia]
MNDINFLRQHDDIEGILSPLQNNIIIGHEEVRHFLAQLRKEKRLHHALLFEGERGIGKATLAFHFAWNILSNQENGFLQPEYDSVIWRQIAQGSHPNLVYVARRFDSKTKKFKTGISIDDIRNMMYFLKQTSRNGEWRVVIIDPADDMNRNAANAILKTLEEPPEKTLFIIITHSSRKLLSTIRSRCQQVLLRSLHDDEMKQVISHIIPKQALSDEETVKMIIQKSEGRPRKAALLISYGGFEIAKTLDNLFKQSTCNLAIVHNLAQALSSFDLDIQFQQFCDEILDRIQKKAILFAEQGALALSKKYAQIWQNIHQEILEMQLFNLDKKQFIINLLFKIHKIIQQT